jgi:hypothetical protein
MESDPIDSHHTLKQMLVFSKLGFYIGADRYINKQHVKPEE